MGSANQAEADEVVLLSEQGEPIGATARIPIHGPDTPLHLAFSSHLFNSRGQVLISRRAVSKVTWPGVWTNSCCGHPRPGEAIEDAVRRRVREELGLTVLSIAPGIPDFRYRAVDASGVVENEICPVFVARVADGDPVPAPDEVAEWEWVEWTDLVAAIEAVPRAFSPWSVRQVPALDPAVREMLTRGPDALPADPGVPLPPAARPSHDSLPRTPTPVATPASTVLAVDELLTRELDLLADEWHSHAGGIGVDVLPNDLPEWLRSLLVGRGKRFRVLMAHWGFVAAGGGAVAARAAMIRAAAALEALHLFALVHDDVMDEADSRRGQASAHRQAEAWHRQARGIGDPETFGRNLAILLGDLAYWLADRVAAPLVPPLADTWRTLNVELLVGQRGDLTGAAAARSDRDHASLVARLKSGRYTVQRPLLLGAQAAGGSAEVTEALWRYGGHVGQAFALRDEYLGVWGKPEETGKPAGNDLLEAKPTVLLSIARERLAGADAEVLQRLGSPGFGTDDVTQLAAAMRAAGVDAELERLIAVEHDQAVAVLDDPALDPAGIDGLRHAAGAVAWRTT
ncbi:isopentenyl-diphosphate Delta-isomerase [Ammonicoccus fulvus]|uniref:Isopentenyl-diphosphate Delta-isomerase n=1 Tax=Ammonicoccus fulvus TaxID=3138240 RepID=A0ABZ3FLG4_9ACTN